MVLLRERAARRSIGAIEPCLPSPAKQPPAGPGWIHEIKHDGFRIMARLDTGAVRLFTRNSNDLTRRFPFVAMAVAALPARSCLIDGEAIVCDESVLAVFDLIRGHRPLAAAVHCAFDLLELDGEDLRGQPIEERKQRLAGLLRDAIRRLCSMSITRATARSSTSTPASSAARVSCRSGSGRRTRRADRRIGSRPRIRRRRLLLGKPRRTGAARTPWQCFVECVTCSPVSAVSLIIGLLAPITKLLTLGGGSWKPSMKNGRAGRTRSTSARATTALRKF